MAETQRFLPLGGLNMDDDPAFIKEGDYTSGKNIRHITENTESTLGIINIRGNDFKWELPEITAHSKTFRVYFLANIAATVRQITCQLANGQALATINFSDGATVTDTQVNIKAATSAALAAAVVPQTATYSDGSDDTGDYTDITITGNYIPFANANVGYDYKFFSSGVNELEIIITQEAIPESLSGQLQAIGSFDLLEDLFVFSTPETNLPQLLPQAIIGATNPAAPNPIVIQTDFPHNLSDGEQVVITGVLGQTGANGKWVINVTGTDTFELINSIGTGAFTSSPDSKVTLYTESVGQIGVMRNLVNTGAYPYLELLTSKEFGFRTQKQIDSFGEKNSIQTNLYWTDDFNNPRCFYYSGAYMFDGALSYVSPDGRYSYGTIADATLLDINTSGVELAFTSQQQSGGAIRSGNWRYSIRLLTDTFVGTDYLSLSNPINVFIPSTDGSASAISGENGAVTCPKINQFTVSGIPQNVFKYVELVGVNYVDLAQVGYTISRTEIGQNQTTIDIQHDGFETEVTDLDLGVLNVTGQVYSTAKNIDAIDNRLILSNLTTNQSIDFSDWTQTWTHSLFKTSIDSVGDPFGTLSVNEYELPENVYSNMSFMANETYRLSAKFLLKDGTITRNFWIDDIRIDTSASNVTTPNRRTTGLADYNITTGTETTYVFKINFAFNIDTTIDGIPARNLVDKIFIEMVEMTGSFREILSTGVFVLGVRSAPNPNATPYEGLLSDGEILTYGGDPFDPSRTIRTGEYFFITGRDNGNFPTYGPSPSGGAPPNVVARRGHLAAYLPDSIYGLSPLSFSSGDQIINFGNPLRAYSRATATAGVNYGSSYGGYTGETNVVTPDYVSIDNVFYITAGDSVTVGGDIYTKLLQSYLLPSGLNNWYNRGGDVVYASAGLNMPAGNVFSDMGVYYGQYYRPITYTASNPDASKFGDRETSKYVPTGALLQITDNSPTNVTVSLSGDVFNQKTYVKIRFANSSTVNPMSPDGLGWDGAISFYSQNRVNTQMTNRHIPGTGWEYPNAEYETWMERGVSASNTPPTYNHGYDSRNLLSASTAYDGSILSPTDLPTRIIWSELKPQSSLADNYRNFLPLNFKDLEPAFGEIVHHANGNGELLTWQQRRFMRQYYNERGTLQVSDGTNVLIGDGAVMSRDGQTLTVIGSKHKWGIIKGKSAQGNDVFYWINTELKKAMRFGYDGTISLADIRGMQSFFANNLKWVDQFDTPAHEFGISGFWDDRNAEAGWTIRARKVSEDWVVSSFYEAGSIVKLEVQPAGTFSNFEEIGDLYRARINHTSSATDEPESGINWETYWEKIEVTDTDYFNLYTVIFNEYKNKFTEQDRTPKPKIYLKWKDGYFSPRPAGNKGKVYLHNDGSYLTWYNDGATSQQEAGHIEGVINKNEEVTKWYEAIDVDSEIVPNRFDFKTKNHISFLTSGEFESREDGHFCPIKEDSTNTGINDGDTTLLFGRWLKAKMTFQVGVYQKLISFIVKYRPGSRLFNR